MKIPEKKTNASKNKTVSELRAESQCVYVMGANGRRCTTARMHGSVRCWKHPPDTFPQTLETPDAATYDNRRIKTLEQIVETQEWVFNQVYLGKIANEKGRILTDMLKAQVSHLNEIWKRTPEGADKTIDQIGKMIAMARVMTEEDASRILQSKNFGASLSLIADTYEGEILQIEEKTDATTETSTLLEGDIPGPGGQAATGDDPDEGAAGAGVRA